MRRHLMTLALAGVFGALLTSAEARACCHKRKANCTPACAPAPCPPPAPVVTCPPPPPPAPVVCEQPCPPPKKCGLFHHNAGCGHQRVRMGGFCHKKAACPAPVAVCETPYSYAPVAYAPVATPQAWPSGQVHASGQ